MCINAYMYLISCKCSNNSLQGVVQVLCMVEEILPAVVNITQQIIPHPMSNPVHDDTTLSDLIHPTTSLHYVTVECDHPYKPASVTKYNVGEGGGWLSFMHCIGIYKEIFSVHLFVISVSCENNLLLSFFVIFLY